MLDAKESFGLRFKKHMLVVPKEPGESEKVFRFRYWWIARELNKEDVSKTTEELIVESKFVAYERFLKLSYE